MFVFVDSLRSFCRHWARNSSWKTNEMVERSDRKRHNTNRHCRNSNWFAISRAHRCEFSSIELASRTSIQLNVKCQGFWLSVCNLRSFDAAKHIMWHGNWSNQHGNITNLIISVANSWLDWRNGVILFLYSTPRTRTHTPCATAQRVGLAFVSIFDLNNAGAFIQKIEERSGMGAGGQSGRWMEETIFACALVCSRNISKWNVNVNVRQPNRADR